MYYQQNVQQNQPNYIQNYTVQNTKNVAQVVNNPQYQYPAYTGQQNQLRAQPQYQQNVQKVQNVQQIQNIQNVPNTNQVVQQNKVHHHPVQNAQNVQYVKVPGQNNVYFPYTHPSQYFQPGQQVQMVQPGQQVQQVQQVQPGHILKSNQYNAKTNVIEANPQIKGQVQYINQEIPNQNQVIQVTNQMVPQPQKMIFKGGKPLSTSHKNPSLKPQGVSPVGVNQIPQTELQKEHKQHIDNPHFLNNTVRIEQNVPIVETQKKVEPTFQMQTEHKPNPQKSATFMTVNSLAVLPYSNYPIAEFSKKPFHNISGYAANSYSGTNKNYNEDKVKTQYKVEKIYNMNGKEYKALISYFGIFDGHGGDGCSKFLKKSLDGILFQQTMFPNNVIESVRETFKTAETQFKQMAVHGTKLNDKSGSCAVIALIINDILYSINLGDSRGLYSRDGGNEYYQITRDHKPNDPKEQKRIENAGGKVYYANKVIINGMEVTLREEQYGPGFKFPYRLSPGGLAVSFLNI